ncbi:SGNH/GDSL hydrolase family protein [Kitasatospora purpeofusca]|uniref:SGNH/GDSL hydrolase family protein n=1 Tax=Kitasatospora purpeofusca TaxID=67352 RepID=UPI002257E149|nr:SGNH/GDSL hydrolase family protein [Kitasatospora purpeofusca]MCX4683354.1 SGNH/GDSL hydrolase family protein [Kitasatospora purpeofusca]
MNRTRPAALAAALLALTTTALNATTGTAHAADVNYVALGDSYSAGGGSSTTYLNSCNQSTNAYPYLYAQATSPATFDFQACGGATSADVVNNQLAPLTSSTTLVSMTIGGNDIGLRDVMASCLLGSDTGCLKAVATAENTARTRLPGKLDTVYSTIRSRATNALVVILGYPRFYDLATPLCPGISPTKRAALNDGADVLNSVIRITAATYPNFAYADVANRFAGHQLCDSASWLHALNRPIGQSFHPTAAGQAGAYLPALQSSD